MTVKIGVISLGCAKNRIDTEEMLAQLQDDYEFVQDMAEADIMLINTCLVYTSLKKITDMMGSGIFSLFITFCKSREAVFTKRIKTPPSAMCEAAWLITPVSYTHLDVYKRQQ